MITGLIGWFAKTVNSAYTQVRSFIFGLNEENEAILQQDVLEIAQVRNRRLLGGTIAHYEIQNHANATPEDFLNVTRPLVTDFFLDNPNNKFQLTLTFVVVKVDSTGNVVEEEETGLSSRQESVYPTTNVEKVYDRMKDKVIESFSNFMKNGSGWRTKRVVKLSITKSRLNPLRGSSHIPLPKKIAARKALINMKNEDDKCFKYAVTRALNPETKKDHAERISKELKKQATNLNLDGIEFPTPCTEKQLKTFEKNNDVSILVFGHEGDDIIPLYVPRERREKVVRLFFQKSKDGKNSHYCVIKSMSRLVSSQLRNHHAKTYVCDYCLNAFGNEDLLLKHEEYCSKHDAVNTIFPELGDNTLKFKNYQNGIECPIKIYADFESILEKTDKTHGKTKLYQRHVPSAFCFYVVSRVPGFEMKPVTYVKQGDEDVAKVFVEKLEETTRAIYKRFEKDVPMIFDDAARKLYNSQTECYACGKPFGKKSLRKVRDHCHYTGKYRGALHSKCNLRLRKGNTIPVFFHNLEGYDSHLFVKRLADTDGDVNCIPHNEEKYITFTKNVWVDAIESENGNEINVYTRLRFVDTMHFMSSSLEKLVKNLDRPMFKHTSKYFSTEQLDLMLQKGVYPYEYLDRVDKLFDTKLPPKDRPSSFCIDVERHGNF